MPEQDDAVARLSEAQRECLRLVAAGYKSKEIAYQLGIGVDAVNKRLAGAMATLQVSSRAVAARRLTAAEAEDGYHSLVGNTLVVASDDAGSDLDAAIETKEAPDEDLWLEEPQASYTAPGQQSIRSRLPVAAAFATPRRVFAFMAIVGAGLAALTRS